MQVLTTECPYCKLEVDSTIEHLGGPVVCPKCNKPFEMEMPTAVVTSVHEVDDKTARENEMVAEPESRKLVQVHPVVFRARPIAALFLGALFLLAVSAMTAAAAEMKVAGYSLDQTVRLGPASLLTWICAITMLAVAGTFGYWVLRSRFTTLTVTDDRTVYQVGLVSRKTSEVQHDDVRNIQLDQSFLQRILKVGGIGISSSGQDDLEVVATGLPQPARIIALIRENQG